MVHLCWNLISHDIFDKYSTQMTEVYKWKGTNEFKSKNKCILNSPKTQYNTSPMLAQQW